MTDLILDLTRSGAELTANSSNATQAVAAATFVRLVSAAASVVTIYTGGNSSVNSSFTMPASTVLYVKKGVTDTLLATPNVQVMPVKFVNWG